MKTVTLLPSEHVKVVQKHGYISGVTGVALILEYVLGQATVEDFLLPILKELRLDPERFFKAFWAHVQRVALDE